MAESSPADPGDRGDTVIEDRVLERIAAHAARDVSGVIATGTDADRPLARRLPKATAEVDGSRARVSLTIAVSWPHPLADVATAVRDHVRGVLAQMTGLQVDAVDVQVGQVVSPVRAPRRRVQ